MRRRRSPARLAWLAAAVVSLASCARPGVLVLRGNQAFRNGDYGEATIAYLRALETAGKAAPYVQYDLAGVYAALGEAAAARETLAGALEGEGRELLFRAYFNLGNLEYEQGRFEEAARSFVEALHRRPGDVDAKVNLEMALRRLQAGSGAARAAARSEPALDARTREILDIARKREVEAWRSAAEQNPRGGNDW